MNKLRFITANDLRKINEPSRAEQMAADEIERLERQLADARSAFGNIRTLIDGRIDTEDRPDGEGVRPNIFASIDSECAVGLGEAP